MTTRIPTTPSGSSPRSSEDVKKPVTAHGSLRQSVVVDDRRWSIYCSQDRFRDPALTTLLTLEICLIFLAAPLAAKGQPIARRINADHPDNGAGGGRYRRHAVPQMRDRSDIARARCACGRHLAGIAFVTGCSERAPPRRRHPRFLRLTGWCRMRSMPPVAYTSPPSNVRSRCI